MAAIWAGVKARAGAFRSCFPLPFFELEEAWESCCFERVGTGTLRSANMFESKVQLSVVSLDRHPSPRDER